MGWLCVDPIKTLHATQFILHILFLLFLILTVNKCWQWTGATWHQSSSFEYWNKCFYRTNVRYRVLFTLSSCIPQWPNSDKTRSDLTDNRIKSWQTSFTLVAILVQIKSNLKANKSNDKGLNLYPNQKTQILLSFSFSCQSWQELFWSINSLPFLLIFCYLDLLTICSISIHDYKRL